jgi:hypothetical protein
MWYSTKATSSAARSYRVEGMHVGLADKINQLQIFTCALPVYGIDFSGR